MGVNLKPIISKILLKQYSCSRDHGVLYFLKKCIILSKAHEAHLARISFSLERPVASRWRASIFSNDQEV